MTDRGALDRMKFMAKGGTNFSEESHEACRIAAEAIRERIERERGCEFCTKKWTCFGKTQVEYIGDGEWLYCPMCGRNLKTAMPGEEEHGV